MRANTQNNTVVDLRVAVWSLKLKADGSSVLVNEAGTSRKGWRFLVGSACSGWLRIDKPE